MSVWAKRRENETVEKLINRFKKQSQNSRFPEKVKEKRYWKKDLTKRQQRISAVKREEYRAVRRANVAVQ